LNILIVHLILYVLLIAHLARGKAKLTYNLRRKQNAREREKKAFEIQKLACFNNHVPPAKKNRNIKHACMVNF
jgi:hypothetical protein